MTTLVHLAYGVCCLLSLFLIGFAFGYVVGKSEGERQSIPKLTLDQIIQNARTHKRIATSKLGTRRGSN